MHPHTRSPFIVLLLAAAVVSAAAGSVHAQETAPDHVVRSTPENVVWGWYPHRPRAGADDPVRRHGADRHAQPRRHHAGGGTRGIPGPVRRGAGRGAAGRGRLLGQHGPTGRARGAAGTSSRGRYTSTVPSRATCSRCRSCPLRTRAPYGINNTGPTSGVFGSGYPGTSAEDEPLDMPAMRHFIRTGEVDGREVAFFADSESRCRWRRSWG